MISHVLTTRNDAGQWEVLSNDGNNTLLGTFDNDFLRDLFIEAIAEIVGEADFPIEPLVVAERRPRERLQSAA